MSWMVVRSGELYEKPVALVNRSPRSTHAQASLNEVLGTLGAKIVDEAAVTLHPSGPIALPEILAEPSLSQALRASLDVLVHAAGSSDAAHRSLFLLKIFDGFEQRVAYNRQALGANLVQRILWRVPIARRRVHVNQIHDGHSARRKRKVIVGNSQYFFSRKDILIAQPLARLPNQVCIRFRRVLLP